MVVFLANLISAEITLGSITDVKFLTLQKGGMGKFKASFFNLGNETLKLEFDLEYPRELRVEIQPKELTIEPGIMDPSDCNSCEFFILKDGKTYTRTHPVYVYVKIPSDISRNLYRIRLIATARSKQGSGDSGIRQSLAQVREVTFEAYVPGSVKDTGNTKSNNISYAGIEQKEEELRVRDITSPQKNKAGGSGKEYGNSGTSEIGGTNGYSGESQTRESHMETRGTGVIERDSEGRTHINLPTGNVVLSRERSETAVDIGIITLAISVISLLARILKS